MIDMQNVPKYWFVVGIFVLSIVIGLIVFFVNKNKDHEEPKFCFGDPNYSSEKRDCKFGYWCISGKCELLIGEDAAEDCMFNGVSVCLGETECCPEKPIGRCVPTGAVC